MIFENEAKKVYNLDHEVEIMSEGKLFEDDKEFEQTMPDEEELLKDYNKAKDEHYDMGQISEVPDNYNSHTSIY